MRRRLEDELQLTEADAEWLRWWRDQHNTEPDSEATEDEHKAERR